MRLREFYDRKKSGLIENCVKCGNCVRRCRVMKHVDTDEKPEQIQESILAYLEGGGALSDGAKKKVDACMRCFGCLDVLCPAEVSSSMINEFVDYETEVRKETPWADPLYPSHDRLARKFTTAKEYEEMTTARKEKGAKVLFFPGCNVYKQPDKLLNALTILDEIGQPYSFAPGLAYCCGWSSRGAAGDAEMLQRDAEKLMEFAESCEIEQMVFWCPTCLCVLADRVRRFYTPAFACISFGEYVLAHMDKLSFPEAVSQRITYHEPCKTSYMGIDAGEENSVRKILSGIPGTEIVEMAHHGRDTLCCGCDAVDKAFAVGDAATVARFSEAAATGAETLVDVCHNCHWIFKPAQKAHEREGYDFHIENYSTYITKAMGKARKDTI